MNYIDVLLVLIAALSVFHGWHRGFVTLSVEIGIWLGSFVMALFLSDYVVALAGLMNLNGPWVKPIFFATLIVCFARLIFVWLDNFIDFVPRSVHNHWSNKLAGILPGLFCAGIYCALISFFFLSYRTGDPSVKTRESKIAGLVSNEYEMPGKTIAAALRKVGYQLGNSITIRPRGYERVPLPFRTITARFRPDVEYELLELINSERAKAGLKPMAFDAGLGRVARDHCRDMGSRSYFSHYSPEGASPFDRIRRAGIVYGKASENLALARDVLFAHEGLMESPVHRANILSPVFTHVGIGVLDAGLHGLLISQVFRN